MKSGQLDLQRISKQAVPLLRRVGTYKALIFFLLIASLYGFILWRINVYSNASPDQNVEDAQVAAQPHIDQSTVQKLLSLQSNSVSVQALFNEARQNPFQE
jgi:hypothetical protein